MTCHGCQACETHPVTLHNGTTVCNYCPSWLRECEARELNKMPLETRRAQWVKIKEKRGQAAADLLFEIMQKLQP